MMHRCDQAQLAPKINMRTAPKPSATAPQDKAGTVSMDGILRIHDGVSQKFPSFLKPLKLWQRVRVLPATLKGMELDANLSRRTTVLSANYHAFAITHMLARDFSRFHCYYRDCLPSAACSRHEWHRHDHAECEAPRITKAKCSTHSSK